MRVLTKEKIERVQVLVKDTEKDKKVTLKWLFENKYNPTNRRSVINLFVRQFTPLKGRKLSELPKCKKPMEIAKGVFLITAERKEGKR